MTQNRVPDPSSVSTTEYAVRCADSRHRHGYELNGSFNRVMVRDSRERLDGWSPCGPHRVVKRSVSAWEPIDE